MNRQYRQDIELIEEALTKLTAFPEDKLWHAVGDAMKYSLLGGGKRIRAVLALEVCKALGAPYEYAIAPACALEMVHAYSLIHDDLPCMDDDDLRRGKPSCHIAFGEATAVLAGDGLQTLAFETLSCEETVELLGSDKTLALIRCISRAIGENGMLGGQTIDVGYEGKLLTPEQHREMVEMKTGALLTAAAECGAIAAGASDEQRALAREFGLALGTAFQIVDDILDVIGDEAALGKPVGSDNEEEKNTFVTSLGLEGAQKEAERLTNEAQKALSVLCPENKFLPALVDWLLKRNS